MFPFTPHTTLRPDSVRAVPYISLKLAVVIDNWQLIEAKFMSKCILFKVYNLCFGCGRIT